MAKTRKPSGSKSRPQPSHLIGIYAGSFDPPTLGHLDLIARASQMVGQLVVAIGAAQGKAPLFSVEERLDLTKALCRPYPNVAVQSFAGLTVDFAAEVGAALIIRGLRSASDYDYEMRMAQMNQAMKPNLHTIFLPTRPDLSHISSSLAREIARHGGDVSLLVPPAVVRPLRRKFA